MSVLLTKAAFNKRELMAKLGHAFRQAVSASLLVQVHPPHIREGVISVFVFPLLANPLFQHICTGSEIRRPHKSHSAANVTHAMILIIAQNFNRLAQRLFTVPNEAHTVRVLVRDVDVDKLIHMVTRKPARYE